MADRSHLSIGEVMALVQEDFADVSISKIRFLESQGLIEPERTPSGYRKFYPHDIERLRWVLRQQRDNFLPLRVIKQKIESGEAAAESAAAAAGPPTGLAHVPTAAGSGGATAAVGAPGAVGGAAGLFGALATDATDEAEVVHHAADDMSGVAVDGVAPSPAVPGDDPLAAASGNVSLTRDELAAHVGLEVAVVVELESYGIISARTIGPAEYFDADAVAAAEVAAAFAGFGVEPRHLRMYRTAAEREAGVFEAVVMPLLKQRNPASQNRARSTLSELARLGGDLHAAMLRQALLPHLDDG